MPNKRICKKKEKAKLAKLEEVKKGDYQERLHYYTEKAKELWGSKKSQDAIQKQLVELQNFLQI
jgi:hypothetical protein